MTNKIQRTKTLFSLFAAAATISVMTSGCTVPASTDSDAANKAEASKLDFAYDTRLNQIAYMSCSTLQAGSYDTSAYFSYRAGAYDNNSLLGLVNDNGGVRLSQTFLDSVKNRSTERKWTLLSDSPANSATVMQLAIRQLGNLQAVQSSSGSATANADFQNMLEELGVSGISAKLVGLPDGKRMRYLTNGTITGSRIEGSLLFGTDETAASSVRNGLNGDTTALTVTYTDMKAATGVEYAARSPRTAFPDTSTANLNRDVYGRGYHLRFTKPASTSTNYPINILQSITEQDLHTLTDHDGTWNCTDLRFKMVLAKDAAAQGCVMKPDELVASPAYRQIKIVRNTLRYEDWWVDMDHRCIIPKKSGSGCYGANTVVQYDLSRDCTPNPATNNALVDLNKSCMAWTSICYRTN